jgi:phosphomevalonate kinase
VSASDRSSAAVARAPGKVLLSGAYAVLEGAPAIVAAVDRWAVADAARDADAPTPEVREALRAGDLAPCADRAPWFDASALRVATPDGGSRKLGLGSSAAILVASLGAARSSIHGDEVALRADVLPRALAAHRAAQGGGSGVDVAASVHGGVQRCRIGAGDLEVEPHALPEGTHVEIFASARSASTPALLDLLRALRDREPARCAAALRHAAAGAERAVEARSVGALVEALDAQFDALASLGPEVPIVLDDVASVRPIARAAGATFGPSGAGGGDVSLYLGPCPSPDELRRAASSLGLERLPLDIGARGLHLVSR